MADAKLSPAAERALAEAEARRAAREGGDTGTQGGERAERSRADALRRLGAQRHRERLLTEHGQECSIGPTRPRDCWRRWRDVAVSSLPPQAGRRKDQRTTITVVPTLTRP